MLKRQQIMQVAKKFFFLISCKAQHIYQNIFRITADGDARITANGDTRITADSDY
jgi:hypothetical protein